MNIRECGAIRDLAAIECDQVGGGLNFGPIKSGPVLPEPPLPPIVVIGPVTTPQHGPVKSPLNGPVFASH